MSTLDELAAGEAAEAGDVDTFAALMPAISFRAILAGLEVLEKRCGWSAHGTFTVQILLSLEKNPPPGVEVNLDWATVYRHVSRPPKEAS